MLKDPCILLGYTELTLNSTINSEQVQRKIPCFLFNLEIEIRAI